MDYSDWLKYRSRIAGRDVSQDESDYDLESYYKSLKYNPMQDDKEAHLPDTYKKPNHPTFSKESIYSIPSIQEGGEWNENKKNKKWEFKPSEVNLQNMPAEHLQKYFEEADPDANVDFTGRFNKLRSKLK